MALPALLPLALRFGGTTAIRRLATGTGVVAAGTALGQQFGGGGGGGRRRRRRRALTASDRADIAFIQATISKAAADRFATQLVAGQTR